MKKVLLFLEDAVKATIGIPILIGYGEILNLIISLVIGKYVRIDEGILQNVVEDYITAGLMGFGLALGFFTWSRTIKDENKDTIQKSKSLILYIWVIAVIVTIINGILLADYEMILILTLSYSVMFGVALLAIYIWDKAMIKKINKKIKENERKN